MLFMRFYFIFLTVVFSFCSWPLSLDWSGWTRMETYYQNASYYGLYNFVVQPKIHVVDGLIIKSRFDLHPLKPQPFSPSLVERQTGSVFFYSSKSHDIKSPTLFLKLSQFYVDYQSEFFKVRLGRAPYHFGMGTSYLATQNPFQHWISIYNQVALYLEYSSFYLQPALLQREKNWSFIGQAGLLKEDWRLEVLYRYKLKSSSFVELFGRYEKTNWEVKGTGSYYFNQGVNMALSGLMKFSLNIPLQLELKTGALLGDSAFHPGYNVALLSWNRLMLNQTPKPQSSGPAPFQIAEGYAQKGMYFSPRVIFSFWREQFQLKPVLFLGRDLDKKNFLYEFDLEGDFHWSERLFCSLKGGILWKNKAFNWALLAQTAVSF